jgi:hypothetical protein
VRRRILSVGSVLLAIAALGFVLVNATLVDRRAPSISGVSLSAPAEGQQAVAQTLTTIVVQFSEPVSPVTLEPRFHVSPTVAGTLTYEGSTATFTPAAKLPQDTEFRVSIEPGFEDLAGNAASNGLDEWVFRTVGPPAVVSADPSDGTAGVGIDQAVTVTFDRLMDTAAVESAVSIDPEVPLTPSWSGRALTISFDLPLAFATTYRLTVGTGAADTDGSRLREPFSTTFTTVAAGLAVVSTVPGDGVAGVSVRTPIAVIFDGPVDPVTAQAALSVTPPVPGNVRVVPLRDDAEAPRPGDDAPAVALVLEPNQPLAPHTTYTVRLNAVVARADSPDEVADGRTWRFTTGQPTPSAHNHIAFLSTRGGTRGVWLMNPDGSAPRQLTAELAPVSSFDVSPDGTQVAVSAAGEVRTVATDGSGETVRTSDGRFEYAPRFSPDGRQLLVARRESDGSDAGWWLVPLGPGAPGERQVLASGAPPIGSTALQGDGLDGGEAFPVWWSRSVWDPSGRWLLITTGGGEVYLLDLQAADPEAAATDTGVTSASAGSWSVSGARFVIAGRAAGGGADGLYTIDTTGKAERVLDARGSAVAASDGRVALLVVSGGLARVAVGDVEGDVPPAVLANGPLADRTPSFSPDGRSVVFARIRPDDPTVSAGIWVVDTAGGAPVPLAPDGAFPRWLP